jgi:hypothetical protein
MPTTGVNREASLGRMQNRSSCVSEAISISSRACCNLTALSGTAKRDTSLSYTTSCLSYRYTLSLLGCNI